MNPKYTSIGAFVSESVAVLDGDLRFSSDKISAHSNFYLTHSVASNLPYTADTS